VSRDRQADTDAANLSKWRVFDFVSTFQRVHLRSWPENILLVGEEDAILSAPCLMSEPEGSHRIVAIKVGDKIVKMTAPAHPKIRSEEMVHLTFKQEAKSFFDKETGLRI